MNNRTESETVGLYLFYIDALILFTSAATRMSFYLTVLFMVACIIVVAYVVTVYLSGSPVLGWTTTMLFMSFGFLSIFVMLGIMLKYLSVIIDLVFKNKTYVTEKIEKLTKKEDCVKNLL